MRKRSVGFHVALAAAIAVMTACGKGSGSPVAPSSAPSQSAAPAMSGATITGTVTSASAASPRSANNTIAALSAGGITVSVMGTSIATTVDGSGRFTLQNVPQGDVTLVFTANGISATITVAGVNVADQIRVSVVVNGSTAELDEHQHEAADHQTEVEGRVTAVACGANPPTITLGVTMPMTVNIQNARIRHGGTTLTCAQIQVNDRAEAHGTTSGTTLIATDVNVETEHPQPPAGKSDDEDDNDDHDQGAEITGTVSGAAAGHACPAFSFSVGSTAVTTSAATKFEDVTCAGVVNGIRVEVKGTRTAANALAATKVEKK